MNPCGPQPIDAPLYVVAVISNPVRFKRRYQLYREFEKYVETSGAVLYTVELALGERAFEVTNAGNPRHIQLRSLSEFWHKENMINIGVSRLPNDWRYVAWVDADVRFARSDWVYETLHQLQHHHIVQLFSHAFDLGPNYEPLFSFKGDTGHKGFCFCSVNGYPRNHGGLPYDFWHPGFGWATDRPTWDNLGGVLEGTLGAADHHMACALIGHVHDSVKKHSSPGYRRLLDLWQERALKYVQKDIGYVPGLLTHGWHGKKKDRGYVSRWDILINNQFDPFTDLKRDSQGLFQLTDDKPALRDQIRMYFRQRNEDSIDLE
jgi:hypothetical protein